jgi:hypothetical protein
MPLATANDAVTDGAGVRVGGRPRPTPLGTRAGRRVFDADDDVHVAAAELGVDDAGEEADRAGGYRLPSRRQDQVVGPKPDAYRGSRPTWTIAVRRVGVPGEHPIVLPPLELQAVRHADEAGHVLGGRPLEDVRGRVELFDLAVSHDRQPVAERQRFALVVGDEDRAEQGPAGERRGAQGLVEQQKVWAGDQAAVTASRCRWPPLSGGTDRGARRSPPTALCPRSNRRPGYTTPAAHEADHYGQQTTALEPISQ